MKIFSSKAFCTETLMRANMKWGNFMFLILSNEQQYLKTVI